RVADSAREAEYLRAALEELDALQAEEGEEEQLAEVRSSMMRSEKIAAEIADAQNLVNSQDSPIAQLSSLLRRLARKTSDAPELVEPIVHSLDESLLSLDAVQESIEAAARAIEFDPRRLEETETRLFALRAASRKYNVPVNELPALRTRFAADLASLDAGEG